MIRYTITHRPSVLRLVRHPVSKVYLGFVHLSVVCPREKNRYTPVFSLDPISQKIRTSRYRSKRDRYHYFRRTNNANQRNVTFVDKTSEQLRHRRRACDDFVKNGISGMEKRRKRLLRVSTVYSVHTLCRAV